MLTFLLALPIALLLGFMAQDTGLCLVRGVNEAKNGQPAMLASILLCGVMLWLFTPLANALHAAIPFARYAVDPLFVVGGLVFGLGAAVNGGCAVATLSRLARGQASMALTILGWPLGWRLAAAIKMDFPHRELGAPGGMEAAVIIVIALLISAWAISGPALRRRHWLSVMVFGGLAGLLFILEPHWSPSDYVRDVGTALTGGMWRMQLPDLLRTALITSVILGMAGCAVLRASFSAQPLRLSIACTHLGAGIAMGIGGAFAMGGNDKQLLTGIPALSPGAIATVLGMLTGILLGGPLARWLQTRKLV